MWNKKFAFIVSSSFSFPFKHFSKIKDLFLRTVLVIGLAQAGMFMIFYMLGVYNQPFPMDAIDTMDDMDGMRVITTSLVLIFGIIFMTFALIPYTVGITRAVVLNETADASVVTVMFKHRQLSYIWSILKITLVVVAILIAILLLCGLIMGFDNVIMLMDGGHMNGNMAPNEAFMKLFVLLTWVIMLIVLPRFYMAPVTAALDKGSSLSNSWELTRGHWLLIVLSFIVVSPLASIAPNVAGMLLSFTLIPLEMLLGPIVYLVDSVLSTLFFLVMLLITMSLDGYIYLVLTNQVKFDEDKA